MTIFGRIKSFFEKGDKDKKKSSSARKIDNDEYIEEIEDVNFTNENKNRFKPVAKDEDSFDWFADRYETLVVQRNVSIFLLIISIVCIAITGISLAVITKSKTIEPFVIEIEKKQGIVTYVNNNSKSIEYTQDEVLRNYFVKKYIEARETFDTKNYDYMYYKVVKSMSNDSAYRQFLYSLRSSNVDNPMVVFANNETSKVNIVSISVLKPKVLQVRFVIEAIFAEGKTTRVNKVAVLEYDFADLATDENKRYINPLSFIVTSYRSSNENV